MQSIGADGQQQRICAYAIVAVASGRVDLFDLLLSPERPTFGCKHVLYMLTRHSLVTDTTRPFVETFVRMAVAANPDEAKLLTGYTEEWLVSAVVNGLQDPNRVSEFVTNMVYDELRGSDALVGNNATDEKCLEVCRLGARYGADFGAKRFSHIIKGRNMSKLTAERYVTARGFVRTAAFLKTQKRAKKEEQDADE
jgi:hypothetical protein